MEDDDELVPLKDQIACVEREIAMRKQMYPRWVANKSLTQARADEEQRRMRAVLLTLKARMT